MKTLPRTQFGNPILRIRSRTVPKAFLRTETFRKLVRQMFYTMRQAEGVGLAAPQIGQPLRLAVIKIPPERLEDEHVPSLRRVIINPRIVWSSKSKAEDWEGCLSFPQARGVVPRARSIQVKYVNEKGEWITEKHAGYTARVFQHEIDHLNGVVYVDRMKDMKTLMTHQEFLKQIV